jgi:hypothetical protein
MIRAITLALILATPAQANDAVCTLVADIAGNMLDMRPAMNRSEVQAFLIDRDDTPPRIKPMLEDIADWVWTHPDAGLITTMPYAYNLCMEDFK